MGKKKTKASKKEVTEALVPIKWNIPDTITTQYATNSTVQILEQEFKICFFEQKPELCFDVDAKPPKEMKVDCVSSVIMNASRVDRLINALQVQLDKYNSLPRKKEK